MPRTRVKKRLAIAAAVTMTLALLGSCALWGLGVMGRTLNCNMTLYYGWGSPVGIFHAYIHSNTDRTYPPLSTLPGNFFPSFEHVKKVLDPGSTHEVNCYRYGDPRRELPLEEQFRQPTYAYFGYALENEDQMLAFLECYPDFLRDHVSFDDDLPAPKGRGSFGGDQFLRLSETLIDVHKEGGWRTPLLIELPDYTGDALEFPHPGQGAYVLYSSGKFDFIAYGARFPMTRTIIEKIGAIKASYAKP